MEKQFYNFVKEVYDKQLGVEGIAIADGEKILMEHHFTPDQARNIYSHTKSYMSTAVCPPGAGSIPAGADRRFPR